MISTGFDVRQLRTRKSLSLMLVAAGLLAVVLYATCLDVCAGVAGTVAGIDLKYLGTGFLAAVGIGLLAGWQQPVFWLLSAGIGAEIFLVAYQVRTGEYCPFCLGFGSSIVALFLLQFKRSRLKTLLLALPLGFLLLLLSFAAAPLPGFGAEPAEVPGFGSGPVEVRLYTDYFCEPCRGMEGELEQKLIALVEQEKARILFLDVPLHAPTPLYAGFFLAMVKPEMDIREVLKCRALLFEAARQNLTTPQELKDFMAGEGFVPDGGDYDRVLSRYNGYFEEDRIRSTPTLVVETREGSEKLIGAGEVLEGMDRLLGS